jgi:hypothetical protein
MVLDQIVSLLADQSGDLLVGVLMTVVDFVAEVFTHLLTNVLERIFT